MSCVKTLVRTFQGLGADSSAQEHVMQTRARFLSRRALLRDAIGAAVVACGASSAFSQRREVPPSIVFVMADDLGYADLSCYGRPDFRTPHIDALAARGVRFLQGYANSPVCSATRLALMTGRYQYRLRLGLEEPLLNPNEEVGLPPEHPTLPSLLQKAGYQTVLIGKWHLGMLPKYDPRRSGYEHFYGLRGGAVDYYTHRAGNGKDDLWDDDTPIQQTGYLTELLGDRAVSAINSFSQTRKPFFLSLHFTAPHWPWEAPGDQAESERIRTASLFHFDGGTQDIYRRMVQSLDAQVGRVVAALDASGMIDNTIVVFTSDNGGERFSNTWPFTGRKTELLEGGLRIPSIISWPARLPKDRTTEQVAMSMDWLPTLLTAAGAKPDSRFAPDGIDLMPVLEANATATPRKLFWRYKSNAQRAMREGDFKFLKIGPNTFLFNLADDPMERANLKDKRKDVYERMLAEWRAWNSTMLPEIDDSYVEGFSADQLADHIGAGKPSTKASRSD
jgi:arylsulfatase A-like enzyme